MSKANKPINLSRRGFLTGAGVALTAGALTLTGCGAQAAKAPEWPFKYVKLDPEVVRKKAHKGYYEAQCCYGVFWSILDELQQKEGYPFTQIPANMLYYGASGVAGWATLCGALNGAFAAINLVTDNEATSKLAHELLGWYSETPLPTQISNQYAVDHAFLVEEYKSDKALPQSVSNSPLCHTSVSKWCVESGFASGSKERSERCGRLSGDVAARTVELLNAYHIDGNFEAVYKLSAETEECRACHSKGKDYELGQYTRGKMECMNCHEEHEITDEMKKPEGWQQ